MCTNIQYLIKCVGITVKLKDRKAVEKSKGDESIYLKQTYILNQIQMPNIKTLKAIVTRLAEVSKTSC